MSITFFTTPKGEEMVVLSRVDYEAMQEAAEHDRAVSDYRAGRLPGLNPDEVRGLVAATSPLAFWRKRAGLTQGALAAKVGVTQNYLSDVENGRRAGPVDLWLKLARVLSVPLEALVDEEDAP